MINVKSFRADTIEKVTGNAKFSSDFNMLDMLHAKILWPKYPVAKIIRIDTSKAENMPGVEKVVTRKDIIGSNRAAIYDPYDQPILVGEGEEVKCQGDAIAIVVADTEEIATEALENIEIEYKPLPGIFTLEEAMEKTKPFFESEIKKGDIGKGFSNAEFIVEQEYDFPYVDHVYMEPDAGYAFMDGQGVINVCYGSQNLARHHRMVCKSLGLAFSKVRLYSPYIGGAFGGKHSFSVQVYLALLVLLLRKPVKLVWTREEVFFASSKRHNLKAKAKLGMDKNGKMLAFDAEIVSRCGPYKGFAEKTLSFALRSAFGAYWFDHIRVVGKAYYTNNIAVGAFRGFGASEGNFIIETLIEKAARKLKLSSEEIRKINWLKKDQLEKHFPGAKWKISSNRIMLNETLGKVLKAAGPKPKAGERKKVGRGIAIGMPCFEIGTTPNYKGTGANIAMFMDGSVNVRIGFPEVGQGITGVITKITSQVLDIPENKISIIYCDTHTTLKVGSLGYSRATYNGGNAVYLAAKKIKKLLENNAQKYLKTDENIEYKKGDFYIGEKMCLKFAELMDYAYQEGINLETHGWFEGKDLVERIGVTFMSGLVDVEIDEETGEIKVLKIVNCHDCGKLINPQGARGQIVGGGVMMMGMVLLEELKMKEGKILTPSLAEYTIPTAKDIPKENIALFVENPFKDSPTGAKGLGEHVFYTVGPALINAIMDATGICITELPITPEKILKALNKI